MKKKAHTKKKAPVVVDRKFVLDLAKDIYDPKTRRFLRLCPGTLQNGPDPTDDKRPMHCGLGELYYAMTGNQPEEDHVDEDNVVDMAVDLSTFTRARARVEAAVKALKLPAGAEEAMIDAYADSDSDVESAFRQTLAAIPNRNDNCGQGGGKKVIDADGDGHEYCSYENYRSRASRVAKQLRKAASFLPE